MARGLRDIVDCERLADEGAVLERVYALADLPRVQDLLADGSGTLRVRFAFAKTESGHAGVTIEANGVAHLACQRCTRTFDFPVAAQSEIEFTTDQAAESQNSAREPYLLSEGSASLAELAGEELLLALPLVPMCTEPEACGGAQAPREFVAAAPPSEATRRPFSGLQDLLKKTDRT